ncbi:MAG TPA: gephyrin-like molybdotransferase Glp [Edaphobacter sp.]|jgi:molybdopterin molybdotransferase|nr:gephyrin-like molybdotransferase Glp [Edaphobacter sp.]
MRSSSLRGGQENVVSFEQALEIVLQHASEVRQPEMEKVALMESLGRILAVPIRADRDQPPFDRSTRDGFAVRAVEANAGTWLAVAGQVQAGQQWEDGPLKPDHAIEIMTGAPVPEGADAVVMLEHVEQSGTESKRAIRLAEGRKLGEGDNIVARGSEALAGDDVLAAGTEMKAAEIALAAACGAATLEVFRRPEVAILATGDELVDVEEIPGPQQIRNSNSYGLAALVHNGGGRAVRREAVPDRRDELKQAITEARASDLIVLSGGVSMGEYDLVEEVLSSFGAEFFFTGVKMQPGKPVVFGRLPEREGRRAIYFFGLPGNPVSTQVTFACFVEPLLRALHGAATIQPRFVQATLGERVEGKPELTRVLPAYVDSNRLQPEVKPVVWQGSGDMAAHARANCYAILSAGHKHFDRGEVVPILLR